MPIVITGIVIHCKVIIAYLILIIKCKVTSVLVQVREQQAQEANADQVAELKEAVKAAQEEAADLQTRLATVVPRDKLTAAEKRIKVSMHARMSCLCTHTHGMSWRNITEHFKAPLQIISCLR